VRHAIGACRSCRAYEGNHGHQRTHRGWTWFLIWDRLGQFRHLTVANLSPAEARFRWVVAAGNPHLRIPGPVASWLGLLGVVVKRERWRSLSKSQPSKSARRMRSVAEQIAKRVLAAVSAMNASMAARAQPARFPFQKRGHQRAFDIDAFPRGRTNLHEAAMDAASNSERESIWLITPPRRTAATAWR
jgi:hypothetical protein